ncbi:CopG family transcriptional regulator [Microbispora sp. NBC_01189]|uniref:CopG family transcriptional regulator n=1 Tax=Microbispora sp. NBC_01189 TaxID=2903583 RepID=UPI002E1311F7|nr:CopG family transcriptional regulator [Microbispora sp. NBC_01189]
MKKIAMYADREDLAVIREAAKRCGISQAEIIRAGIRLAAMANRVWDEPLDWPAPGDGVPSTPGKRE